MTKEKITRLSRLSDNYRVMFYLEMGMVKAYRLIGLSDLRDKHLALADAYIAKSHKLINLTFKNEG